MGRPPVLLASRRLTGDSLNVIPQTASMVTEAQKALDALLMKLEAKLNADCLGLIGPIQPGFRACFYATGVRA